MSKDHIPVPGAETVLRAGQTEAAPDSTTLIQRWGASLQGRTNKEVGLELLRGGAQSFPLSNVLEPNAVRPSRSKEVIHFGAAATIPSVVVDVFIRHVSLQPEATAVYVPLRLTFTEDGTIAPSKSEVLVLNRTQYQNIVRAREAQRKARE